MKSTVRELDKSSDAKKTVDVFKLYNALRTMNGHEPVTAEEFRARASQDSPLLNLAKEL